MSISDPLRRICNQAFFERIHICEVEHTPTGTADHGEPFNLFFNPALHTAPLDHEARCQNGQTPDPQEVGGLNNEHLVELTGFEPVTSSMPWKRATNCAIAPLVCPVFGDQEILAQYHPSCESGPQSTATSPDLGAW